jgi:hypothetical protein
MTTSLLRSIIGAPLCVLWPAFFAAGVLELLVFAFVDPNDVHLLGGERLDWPRQAVYTVAFFLFWAIVAAAGFTMRLLDRPGGEFDEPSR